MKICVNSLWRTNDFSVFLFMKLLDSFIIGMVLNVTLEKWCHIFLKNSFFQDKAKNQQLTVLTDRSEGGASLESGTMELLVSKYNSQVQEWNVKLVLKNEIKPLWLYHVQYSVLCCPLGPQEVVVWWPFRCRRTTEWDRSRWTRTGGQRWINDKYSFL